MAHLNPLEKEFLIRQFKLNGRLKQSDFCTLHYVSDAAFRKWLKQDAQGGLEGLIRADAEFKEVLPEGKTVRKKPTNGRYCGFVQRKRPKNYAVQMNEAGVQEYVRLKEKSLKQLDYRLVMMLSKIYAI